MPDFFESLTKGFMPHGVCLRWDGPLLFVFIAGNLGIAIAYFLIPLALRHFVGHRKDLPYPHMFKLFAAFILSCGVTHLVKIWTLYQPVYWIEAAVDMWTAGVSLLTAALLFPLIPRALALRSPRELQEANDRLAAEIEERKRAEEESRKARDAAVEANKLKSQFVANISHEVRTPMSGILGLTELLLMDDKIQGEHREIADRILTSSRRLLGVLNDLLDFSKLEAGRIDSLRLPFSVYDLVQEITNFSRPAATEKGLILETVIPAELRITVIGDGEKINHVLMNLIHNAAKFTEKGTIKVAVEVVSSTEKIINVKFDVKDTGIGIPQDSQGILFQPFVQADGSIRRRFGGSGLGLSISKRFVELMGGTIHVESVEGVGSTFSFTVPLERLP